MTGLDPTTLHPFVRHALDQAVRSRLAAIETIHADDRERLRSRRRSLDLLHLAVKEGGVLDGLQLRVLLELLDEYVQTLRQRPVPFWPRGQYRFLVEVLEEEQAVEVARAKLREALARCDAARREREQAERR